MILLIKYLLCVAGGVGLGIYISHDNARRRFDEELDRRIKEEIENAEEFFRLKYESKRKADAEKQTSAWFEDEAFAEAAVNAATAMGGYLGQDVDPKALTESLAKMVDENPGVLEKIGAEPIDVLEQVSKVTSETPGETKPESVFDKAPVGMAARFEKPKPPVDYSAISKIKEAAQEAVVASAMGKVQQSVEISDVEPEPEPSPLLQEKINGSHPAFEIPMDEFVQNKSGLEQHSFTYFVGDDVLADDHDMVVQKSLRERLVSKEMIQKLKVGPEAMNGENSLYIRNPDFNEGDGVEADITRSSGKYSVEVGNNTE